MTYIFCNLQKLKFIRTKAKHVEVKKIIKLPKGRQQDRNVLYTKLCTEFY